MRYDLVIFDFDGTLADSTSWMIGVLNDMADLHGFRRAGSAEIDRLRSRPTRDVISALGIAPWKLPSIAWDMRRRSAADAGSIPLYPGALQTLRELTDVGVTLAVVSSNGEATVRSVLGEAQHLIDAYSCSASLFGKAAKLRAIAERFAAPASRTLYVGDETRDIEAAFEASMAVGAVPWGYAHRHALEAGRPTHLVDSFSELVDLVVGEPRLTLVRPS